MNVSFRWLASFFPARVLDAMGPEELARRLTLQGLAVDEVRRPFAPFSGVVLGKVLDVRPHPNADRLTLCTIVAGDDERQVVCGAPNVEVGALYGYAIEGARLPGDRTIRRSKIRGIESQGMLCSAPELGLGALGSADGIWSVLGAAEADLGRDLREILGMDDAVLAIDVTSNRGDALSHWGIAREVQWLVGEASALPEIAMHESSPSSEMLAAVTVEDEEGCPAYLGRLIEGVRVAPSPAWLQTRLLALGQRPINNIVDVTNFVMLECGQPLHPFDFEKVAGGRIVVRRARPGEQLTTLDGKIRALDPEMTMIADDEQALAIAGVMGGLDSEVGKATSSVFLEGAHFDPARVGHTARRLGLSSEASTRFARGVDTAMTSWALDRAAALSAATAGGRVAKDVVGTALRAAEEQRIPLRLSRLEMLVGRPIPSREARRALETLGFKVEERASLLATSIPSWRFDIHREVDLIEEVARLTGYEAVPPAPLPAPPVAPAIGDSSRAAARLGASARAAGFDEARTPSFVGEDVLGATLNVDKLVEIRNPISRAERFLRPFVFTTLGQAVAHNLNRGATRVKLYEIGHAFAPPSAGDGAVDESRRLALVAAGSRDPLDWSEPGAPAYDFFDLKGDLEDVLWHGASLAAAFVPGERPYLHPGRQAEIAGSDGGPVGFCGELHPDVATAWGVEARLMVAECDLEALPRPRAPLGVREVPREPAIERDLALVVPDAATTSDVLAAVGNAAIVHLAAVRVFDRYRGPQVESGHYSLGLRLTFQADRTLTDEEVDRGVGRLIEHLAAECGYRLR